MKAATKVHGADQAQEALEHLGTTDPRGPHALTDSSLPESINLAELTSQMLEDMQVHPRRSQLWLQQLKNLVQGLCIVQQPDGKTAIACIFGNEWLLTACHVILSAEMLQETCFRFLHLPNGPDKVAASASDGRRGWYMWNRKEDISTSVPDLTVIHLPALKQLNLGTGSLAPFINGDALMRMPADQYLQLAFHYGQTISTDDPQLQVSSVKRCTGSQVAAAQGCHFSSAIELCSADMGPGSSGTYVVTLTKGVDPVSLGASHLMLGQPIGAQHDMDRCMLKASAIMPILTLLANSINERLAVADRQHAEEQLAEIRQSLPDDEYDAYIPFGRGVHPTADPKEEHIASLMLDAWKENFPVVDKSWKYGANLLWGEDVEAVQDYGQDQFSKKDAWKWKSIRFDVGVPLSSKKTSRTYQNIALQMGPKTKNQPTKKERKEGNCLAQAVVPCGSEAVQLQGQTMPAQQYVDDVFRRSFQTACNIDEVVLLEAGEEQLLAEKAKQAEGFNERASKKNMTK